MDQRLFLKLASNSAVVLLSLALPSLPMNIYKSVGGTNVDIVSVIHAALPKLHRFLATTDVLQRVS